MRRKIAIAAGGLVLGAALWFGVVYGFICEFAKAVDDG